jgi:hypothetical protein
MSATVIPFPLASRRAMIDRQAKYATDLGPDAAERHIQHQLKIQADAMRRRGVDEGLVGRELRCMESAVRGLMERAISGGAQ